MKSKSKAKKTIIVSLVLIVVGLLLSTVAFALANGQIGVALTPQGIMRTADIEALKTTKTVEEKLSPFHQIDMDAGYMDIKFEEGADFGIKIVKTNCDVTYKVENDLLTIKTELVKANIGVQSSFLNFTPTINAFNSNTDSIVVTYPKGTEFKNISATVYNQDADFSGIKTDNLSVDGQYSEMKLDNMDVKKMDIMGDTTDISMKKSTIDVLTGDLKYMALKMDGTKISGTMDITGYTVDISGKNLSAGDAVINMEYGSLTLKETELQSLTSKLYTADSNLQMTVRGNIGIDAKYSDINLNLSGKREDYAINVKSEYGEIQIDGRETRSISDPLGSRKHDLIVKTYTGDTSIKFVG